MRAFIEGHIQPGADPRGHAEYGAICAELGKLNHPARPDVDWEKIQRLSRILLRANGPDLQTVAFYTLAQGHRNGLDGCLEGVMLLKAMTCEWASLWPATEGARIDILNWLFTQLQCLLRSLELTTSSLPAMAHLTEEINQLSRRLENQMHIRLASLDALGQQLAHSTRRALPPPAGACATQHTAYADAPVVVAPVVILHGVPAPSGRLQMAPDRPKHRMLIRGGATAAVVALLATLWFWVRLSGEAYPVSLPFADTLIPGRNMDQPVSLSALSLFKPHSAELRPDSTQPLVEALLRIKSRPGWLILVAGHSDSSGDPERNVRLSHARALAVRDWLHKHSDIPSHCFVVQGLGASQPFADNQTSTGRAANRRVEIRLIPGPGAARCRRTATEAAHRGRKTMATPEPAG